MRQSGQNERIKSFLFTVRPLVALIGGNIIHLESIARIQKNVRHKLSAMFSE